MSDFVLDASLALQWFLEDEADRKYSLAVLAASPKNALQFPSCGSMKSVTDCSWPTVASGSHLIRLAASLLD